MKVQHYLCPTIEVPLIDGSGGPEDGQPGAPGEQQEMPDLAAAAAELGITEEELEAALGDPSLGSPDFAAAATELGVTEEALMEALGVSAGAANKSILS